MITVRTNSQADLLSLETAAISARSGFACMFSSSDEYENALISERRAQGRYAGVRSRWPVIGFGVITLFMFGAVLFWM